MKRFIAVLLTAVLCLSLVGHAQEEAPFTGYYSDFTMGLDGWYPRSADNTVELKRLGYVIEVRGRTASWNSPGRDFPLQAGVKYRFSVDVKQCAAQSVEFMVSVAHTKDGVETYENLARATVKQGPWTTISGEYTPEPYDKYTLYVETVGNGDINFMMRDFTVEPVELHFAGDLPSLKEVYADYFDVGSCVNGMQMRDKAQIDFFATQYNIFTHENELKPDSVLDVTASKKLAKEDETAVAVKFTSAKPMLDYCQKNGIKVHGHVLVWHSQTPDVFFREGYKSTGKYVSREVMLARLDNYIRLVMEYTDTHYPGVIVSWDVVNEAMEENEADCWRKRSPWYQTVGTDFVLYAFRFARKYAAEGVKLFYNDYNTFLPFKRDNICEKILKPLLEEKLVDGMGMQAHLIQKDTNMWEFQKALHTYGALGLEIQLTELDIHATDPSKEGMK